MRVDGIGRFQRVAQEQSGLQLESSSYVVGPLLEEGVTLLSVIEVALAPVSTR